MNHFKVFTVLHVGPNLSTSVGQLGHFPYRLKRAKQTIVWIMINAYFFYSFKYSWEADTMECHWYSNVCVLPKKTPGFKCIKCRAA